MKKAELDSGMFQTLKFPKNAVPESPLCKLETHKQQFLYIFNKFVNDSMAEFPVNLSYYNQLKFKEIAEKINGHIFFSFFLKHFFWLCMAINGT